MNLFVYVTETSRWRLHKQVEMIDRKDRWTGMMVEMVEEDDIAKGEIS